jgi:hypothetical protein
MHTNDTTNHQGDAPKEEMTQPRHRRPNQRPALEFPLVLEAGKSEQRQDNDSKEVMAPAGVAIVRTTLGFRPGLAVDPNTMGHAEKSRLVSVFWIPRYPSPPAPRPLQRPSFGLGCNDNQSCWRRPS